MARVGAAKRFSEDDRNLGNRGGGVGEQHFCAVADDAAMFLIDAGQKTRNIDEGYQRDIKGVAETDETRGLIGSIDVQHAGDGRRLIGDNPNGATDDAGETDDNVRGVTGLYFEEITGVDYIGDDFANIVGLLRIGGHEIIQSQIGIDPAIIGDFRRIFGIIGRKKTEQFLANQHGMLVVLGDEMDDTGTGHVGVGTPTLRR